MTLKLGQRVQIADHPDSYYYGRIRRIANEDPFYEVEDQMGNTGLYHLSELNLDPPPPRKRKKRD